MTKPTKAYGQDRTKPIQSIDLGAFSILSFKLMAKYRHLPYEQYREAVALGMELLEEIPERDCGSGSLVCDAACSTRVGSRAPTFPDPTDLTCPERP